ncbi:MAG TPA: MurR/RpiR family transcriptional regulator [Candidatus Acidoferrales bacterium]|nr:MurR/RpiR family transcriptional regulator [Candidatus Acidoferrales bacterium]
MELLEKIQKRYGELSASQRKIADYIASNGVEISFDSIVELAAKIGVSEPSIVRFAQLLGFKGYPEFRKELQEELRQRVGNAARLRRAVSGVRPGRFFDTLLRQDMELIEQTRSDLAAAELARAIDLVCKARRILIVGFRSAFALAYFLYFRFARLRLDARLAFLTGGTSLMEQLVLLGRKDLVIAIAFDHTPRETRTAVDYARRRGIPVLGISHLKTSEIARKASVCLLARRQTHITQSLAAPMALLNALAIGVANRNKSKALHALRQLDAIEAYAEGSHR